MKSIRLLFLGAIVVLLVWMGLDLSHGSHVGPSFALSFPGSPASSSAPASLLVASSSSSCTATGYAQLACRDAQAVGIPSALFVNQIKQESGFQPGARGSQGEIGIAQFMPLTARGLGLNPYDPVASLKMAAHVMASYQQRFGNYAMALAAYNAGSGTVAAAVSSRGSSWGLALPASTRRYVCAIMQKLCF